MKKEIIDCLMKGLYQTPENLRNRINSKYDKHYYVETISRELRKLRNKGIAECKPYPNKTNNRTHNRWKLVEQ